MELGKAHAISYNIFIDASFHHMKVVGAINVLLTSPFGLNLNLHISEKKIKIIKGHFKLHAMNFDELVCCLYLLALF